MPDNLRKALDRIQRLNPKRPQYTPHCWSVSAYGKRLQMELDSYESKVLEKKSTKIIQLILENMRYYARSVDPTMLRATNEIL